MGAGRSRVGNSDRWQRGCVKDRILRTDRLRRMLRRRVMTKEQREQVRRLRVQGKGYKQIGGVLGIPVSTVKSFCRREAGEMPPAPDGHVGVYIGGGYAIEERGFNYGCVKTKVSARKWTHWYRLPFIDYGEGVSSGAGTASGSGTATSGNTSADTPETSYVLGSRLLKKGSKGTDVRDMQELLLQLGYALPRYGADGEYGSETESAVKAFQKAEGLEEDGKYGDKTHAALMDAVANDDEGKKDEPPEEEDPETPAPVGTTVVIVSQGGKVNIRYGNGTSYARITSVQPGSTYPYVATAANGWNAIAVSGKVGWVSGDYSMRI